VSGVVAIHVFNTPSVGSLEMVAFEGVWCGSSGLRLWGLLLLPAYLAPAYLAFGDRGSPCRLRRGGAPCLFSRVRGVGLRVWGPRHWSRVRGLSTRSAFRFERDMRELDLSLDQFDQPGESRALSRSAASAERSVTVTISAISLPKAVHDRPWGRAQIYFSLVPVVLGFVCGMVNILLQNI